MGPMSDRWRSKVYPTVAALVRIALSDIGEGTPRDIDAELESFHNPPCRTSVNSALASMSKKGYASCSPKGPGREHVWALTEKGTRTAALDRDDINRAYAWLHGIEVDA